MPMDTNDGGIKNQRCLVTGATGFIGSHLVEALLTRNASVTALVRPTSKLPEGWTVPLVRSELHDLEFMTAAMRNVDVVYHLAGSGSPSTPATHHEQMIQTNITGTLNVLKASVEAGVRRVVMASSASVYGSLSSSALHEDMMPQPVSVYGITKLAAEQLCEMYSRVYGLQAVSLRIFNVYGPGDDRAGREVQLIPTLMRRIREGLPCTIYGDGRQTRDFIHVLDAVRAIVQAGEVDDTQHMVLNVGTGHAIRISELLPIIAAAAGVDPLLHYAPSREGEVRHAVADIGRMRAVLGFLPSFDIEQGIQMYVSSTTSLETRATK